MAHVGYGDKVRKAILAVARVGLRFLSATKASPKEMMAVVGKPLIQHAVEEAIDAGIIEMIFIIGRTKRRIADHFDEAYEFVLHGKTTLLAIAQNIVSKGIRCNYIRQTEALGFCHAGVTASHLIGNELFAVIFADDLISSKKGVLHQMVDNYEQYNIAVKQRDCFYPLDRIVEKPDCADAIQTLPAEEQVLTYDYEGTHCNFGSKLALLKANIELGFRHHEIDDELRTYLNNELLANT